ncbi:MAG: DUF6531 domain-containing protein [Thermodesulfobacteriota bacterium]
MGKPGAKKLDQIISVTPGDVHIIMIPSPGGPVPTPIPHPVPNSLIKDKVAKKVKVMGQPGAVKGSKSQHTPPHIPQGGPFQKPPSNKGEIITGSSNVFYEGKAAAMLGDTGKMCADPTDAPVGKVIGKAAMVLVGGGASGGGAARDKASAEAMKAAAAAAHKWINANMPPGADREQAHRDVCSVTGHPIDVATGKLVTKNIDLTLPGRIPFEFTRNYSSARSDVGAFGYSWRHSYEKQLIVHSEFISLRDENGRFLEFEPVAVGESSWNVLGRLSLTRTSEGYWIEDPEGLRYLFEKLHSIQDHAAILSLEFIVDRYENRISFQYDPQKRLHKITDSAGRRIFLEYNDRGFVSELRLCASKSIDTYKTIRRYVYSDAGDLVQWFDERDHAYRFEYQNHLLVKETDRAGFSFYFTYDERGWCRETWGDGGILYRMLDYDLLNQRTRVIDSLGYVKQYIWNENGVVTQETHHQNDSWTFDYNDSLQLTRTEDPVGNIWSYEYDENGRLVADQNPEGHGIACEYDEFNRLTKYIDRAGNEWCKEYNDSKLQVKFVSPDGNTTIETLNEKGDVVHILYSNGKETISSYDDSGNYLSVKTSEGLNIQRRYNSEGELVEKYDQYGQLRKIEYNQSCLPVRIWRRGLGEIYLAWDSENRVEQITDSKGRTTQYEYTHLNKIYRILKPNGLTVSTGQMEEISKQYSYDTESRVTEVVFFGGDKALFHYGVHERPLGFEYPDGRVQRCERDGRGAITKLYENDILVFEQECDSAGRPLKRVSGDGEELFFEYNPFGKIVNASGNREIGSVEFEYDELGRQLKEEGAFGKLENVFTDGGRTQKSIWNDDLALAFSSSSQNKGSILSGIRNGMEEMAIQYDEQNRLIHSRFANGAFQSLKYGDRNMPESQTRFIPSDGEEKLHYYSDSEELLIGIDQNDRPLRRYERDELNRLISMSRWNDGKKETYSWRFDRVGNRVLTTDPAGTEYRNLYSNGHRITRMGDDKLKYDNRARVIEWHDSKRQKKQFNWNALGQLKSVEFENGSKIEMRYDALGRRIEKITSDGATRFFWNNELMVHESRPNGEEFHYLYYPDSYIPLACYIKRKNDNWRFHTIFNDFIGMPEKLADEQGQIVWSNEQTPFGEIIETEVDELQQNIAMPGQYRDEEIGLHYNFFRYYLPPSGSYISPDPIGFRGGDNLFAYVQDPVCWADPLGLSPDDYSGSKKPDSATKVVALPETTAPRPVKPEDAVDKWEEFLGEEPYTNIHPRTGIPDDNRLVSADGKRSIRYGSHEMNGKPTKHHYHEETWTYDETTDTMTVTNTQVRVPLPKK